MTKQHAIYGLYLPDHPGVILYVGSWRVATLDERLRQHHEGECRTTAKMSRIAGVKTVDLWMRVLRYWMSGVDPNPEGEVVLALQSQGQCLWNFPHALTTDDSRRGGRKTKENGWHQSPEGQMAHSRAGRIGGPIGGRIGGRNQSLEGKIRGRAGRQSGGRIGGRVGNREGKARSGRTLPREAKARGGRIGGRNTSRENHARAGRLSTCARWHSDRPKIDRLCAECAAKVSQE